MSRSLSPIPWLVAASAVLTLVLLPSSSFSAAQPLIVGEWRISSTEAGVIFSAHQIGYVLATLVLVPLTDRLDARMMVVISALAAGTANLLFPILSYDVASAAALRAVAGIGLAGVYMPGVRLVAAQFTERRGAAVGMYVAAFYLGTSISLLATGALLSSLGWREAIFIVSGAACLAPLIALLLLTRPGSEPQARTSGLPDLSVLKHPATRLVILAYSAHTWELYVVRAWLSPYLTWTLTEGGLPLVDAAAQAAAASGLASLPTAVGVLLGGALSDKLGRARGASVFLLASGLGSLTIGWLAGLPWPLLVATALVYSILVASDSAVYSTAVTELAEPAKLGATQAAQSSIGFTASVIAPVIAGMLLDLTSGQLGWGLAFGQAGLVALLGVYGLSRLRVLKPTERAR